MSEFSQSIDILNRWWYSFRNKKAKPCSKYFTPLGQTLPGLCLLYVKESISEVREFIGQMILLSVVGW